MLTISIDVTKLAGRTEVPRKKLTATEKELKAGRWNTLGPWIRSQRMVRGLTEEEAAKAANVSTRQWIRYEGGAKVLPKRFPGISNALNEPIRRIKSLAGYKATRTRHDTMVILKRIIDMMRAEKFDFAFEELLLLYDRFRPDRDEPGKGLNGLTPPHFAQAVILLDGLPKWLFKDLAICMRRRFNKRDEPTDVDIPLRLLVMARCVHEIVRLTPDAPVIPHLTSVGTGERSIV